MIDTQDFHNYCYVYYGLYGERDSLLVFSVRYEIPTLRDEGIHSYALFAQIYNIFPMVEGRI